MAVDLSVFERQKSVIDQQQLQDAFELKKALAVQGAQRNALEMQALQAQATNGGLTLKDMMGFQIQQQNNLANQDIRREGLEDKKAAKEEKIQAAVDVKNRGKQDFEDGLANLAARYTKLKELGGITSVKDSGISNFATSVLGTSGMGQGIGSLLGTEAQSERNSIAGEVPLLTQSIKGATGMSAQQMNSNVELQTFLKALGDPKNDYEANMGILSNLSNRFGTGEVAKGLTNNIGADGRAMPPVNQGGVPEGAVQVGTAGGKPVYKLPDGRGWTP